MASGPEGPYEAKVLLPECPVGRVGCFSGALRGEGACFVAGSEHPGGALGLTYRRYLSMRGRLSRRRGCAVVPRVVTTCRPSGSAVPASREEPSIYPRHWFGCGIERGLSYPACETRDGRCASFRLILGQGAEVAEREVSSNEREVGERVCRLTGVETSDPPGEKAGVQNACGLIFIVSRTPAP